MILAGDVGATKILLEVGEPRSDGWDPAFQRRYQLNDFANITEVLARFGEEWSQAHRGTPLGSFDSRSRTARPSTLNRATSRAPGTASRTGG